MPNTTPPRAAWRSSAGSDAYEVSLYTDISYTDRHGHSRYYYLNTDTVLTATAITFTSSELFPDPDSVASVTGGYGSVSVSSISGPIGDRVAGNVTGDGIGAIYGVCVAPYQDLQWRGSAPLPAPPNRPERFRFPLAKLRRVSNL